MSRFQTHTHIILDDKKKKKHVRNNKNPARQFVHNIGL